MLSHAKPDNHRHKELHIPTGCLNPHRNNVCTLRRSLCKSLPFIIIERGTPVDKEFPRGRAMLILKRIQNFSD